MDTDKHGWGMIGGLNLTQGVAVVLAPESEGANAAILRSPL